MAAPTRKALATFWDSQPEGDYTCSDCGVTRSKSYVQPQHPYYAQGRTGIALCADCISRHNREITAAHKAELAAAPRCELCPRRGTQRTYGVLLCGVHFKNVKNAHDRAMGGAGWLGMFSTVQYSREHILEMAVRS